MLIITPTSRNLRKRNFEQLRPYTAERIQAKSQGIAVEVDKEVLRRENGIPENYEGQRFSLSPTLFDDERSEEDGDDISIDDDSNHESSNEEEIETEFSSNHGDLVSISSDESITSDNRDENELYDVDLSSDDEI